MVIKMMNLDNNRLIILALSVIAILCIALTGGIFIINTSIAKDILIAETFAPLSIIIAGLIGFLKS